MGFEVSADAYGRFMGRFSEPLADEFVALVEPIAGQRALDVGCGPGALTGRLVSILGEESVAAIDPSPSFLEAVGEQHPGITTHLASAEDIPFDDGVFDLALAQLVVHFMTDPVQGMREMGRVTKPGGTVAASVWDLAGGRAPHSPFWKAARSLDPGAGGEGRLAGTSRGHLAEIATSAGLEVVESTELTTSSSFDTFDEWWDPYTFGVGPAGDYVARLDEEATGRLREACRDVLRPGPFEIPAVAWCVVARRGTTGA
ncbi:MAG TPA: class I SAM-dependent methyltransferase [Acidimicrobiia bacterium]|nr:class I SAM-dependent methyltransferase [Acidimicrobiia bacterium]